MPKGPRGENRPADLIGCAMTVARIAIGDVEDDRRMDESKRLNGMAGGNARAAALGEDRRKEIARAAATARWKEEATR